MVVHWFAVAGLALGFIQVEKAPAVKNPGLVAVLARMVKVDQDLRLAMAQSMKDGKPVDQQTVRQMQWIDAENTGRLREIVTKAQA